jgi:hypothetical protein
MFHYYVLSLTEFSKENIPPEILEFVEQYGFGCLNDEYLPVLAETLDLSFKETLRFVFATFIQIEHAVTHDICKDKPNSNPSSIFQTKYYNTMKACENKNKKDICGDLRILHSEDEDRIYTLIDNSFFSSIYAGTNEEDEQKNYNQVLILLDNNKEYLGHIYLESWLSKNFEFLNNLYLLEFEGIRSSLRNNLCTNRVKGVASIFIKMITTWASSHGYTHIRVGPTPIGVMAHILSKCGFDSNKMAKISDIKCIDNIQVQELLGVDIFSEYYESGYEDFDFEEWYSQERKRDKDFLESMFCGYEIAKDLHKLYKMSYPDRTPTKKELESILVTTYDFYPDGYKPNEDESTFNNKDITYEYNNEKFKVQYKGEDIFENKDGDFVIPGLVASIRNYGRIVRHWQGSYSNFDDSAFNFYQPNSIEGFTDRCIEEVERTTQELKDIDKELDRTKRDMNQQGKFINVKNILENGDKNIKKQVEEEAWKFSSILFKLRIRFNNFLTWYKELLFAINYGLQVEYNKKQVGDLIASIRNNFEFIPLAIVKFRPRIASIITSP